MTRPLPWTELVEAISEDRLGDMKAGLAADGVDDLSRDAFLLHRSVGNVLRDMVPEGGDPLAVNAYGSLLHMLFVLWSRGWPVRAVTLDTLRSALASSPAPGTRHATPVYVQLPRLTVWSPGEPAEAFDGLFVLEHAGRLNVVAVLGVNELRAGFTTVEAEAPLPLSAPAPRDDGSLPFSSVLAGGERAGLISVVNGSELAWLGHVLMSSSPRVVES